MSSLYPNLPPMIEVIDCTLRDGEQAPGVWFTCAEKLELARLLSEAGVAVLDAGFPASSSADLETMQELKRLGLKARIGATARALKSDVIAAERAQADEIFLFMPTSDLRLSQTLGVTREQASGMFRAGAEEAVGRGMVLNLVFEDASRTEPSALYRLADELIGAVPVERLVICDTVGCAVPRRMELLIEGLRLAFGAGVTLTPHCHDDFGLATANTLAAVAAGARAVTCTVNGIGERAGNADLAETVAGLTHLYGVEHGIDPKRLPLLAERVERLSGIHTSATKPVTGFNVFRHESGVHVDGMFKTPLSYEFLPSGWVGRTSGYVLGKHSGRALLERLVREAEMPLDEDTLDALLKEVKQLTEQRSKDQHERAYATKEAFLVLGLSGVDPGVILNRYAAKLKEKPR